MNEEYKRNIIFASNYTNEIKQILIKNAMHFISVREATTDEDMNQATDLVVMVEGGEVAIRIRRKGYHKHYRDLTIRSYNNGHKTELQKIKEGWARWYLYLWVGDNDKICDWILVNLDKLREANIWDTCKELPNIDNVTKFIAISAYRLKSIGCLIAEYAEKGFAIQPSLFDNKTSSKGANS